jgi:hypothetical protein
VHEQQDTPLSATIAATLAAGAGLVPTMASGADLTVNGMIDLAQAEAPGAHHGGGS